MRFCPRLAKAVSISPSVLPARVGRQSGLCRHLPVHHRRHDPGRVGHRGAGRDLADANASLLESRTVDALSWGRNLTTGRSIHGCINPEDNIMAGVATLSNITSQSGLARYFEQIRRFPLLEPQEEFLRP
jgi:hypothetical protein